jgi:hypothetical protein
MNSPTVAELMDYEAIIASQQKVIDDQMEKMQGMRDRLLALQEGVRESAKFIRNGQFETGIQLIEALLERMK